MATKEQEVESTGSDAAGLKESDMTAFKVGDDGTKRVLPTGVLAVRALEIAEALRAVQMRLFPISGPADHPLDISWQIVMWALADTGQQVGTYRKVANLLVDATQVRSIRPYRPDGIPPYLVVTYHNGDGDNLDVDDPDEAIAEFQRADIALRIPPEQATK